MSLLSSFFRLAAPLSKPHPNPVTGGQHWFHGTGHEFYDDGDPEVPADPGGTLRPPDREAYEYGQHAGEHWNTDLGVHFTSEQRTAEAFATGTGSHAIRPHENSRIAHAKLHMANPKSYGSEHDMADHAIEWAHKHGHHYLEGSARHDDQWEDHLDQGGYYSEIPDHEHLEYVDAHTTGAQQRRSIDVIDRHHGLDDASGPEKDRYLALHPHREEITSGFKEHLRSQGYDGVTYGNEYEPPHGHRCAIPFDHDQINLTHWQWLDPRREHLNRHQEGKEPQPEQKERLFDRNYTPEHGYHWSDPEGKKIGLLQHFAAPHPATQQDWYHGGNVNGGKWLHHLPGHQNTGNSWLHVGTQEAALARIDPDQWGGNEHHAKHARLHRLRVAPGARVCPHIHPDAYDDVDWRPGQEPGTEPAGSLDFTGQDCGDYDAHRYHNDHEDKGSLSMVVRPHMVRVEEDLGRHPKWSDPTWEHANFYTDTGKSFTSDPRRQEYMKQHSSLLQHFAFADDDPGPYYHASPHEFAPGDRLVPPGKRKDKVTLDHPHSERWRNDRIWLAKDPEHTKGWSYEDERDALHVYEVQPIGVKKHDPDEYDLAEGEEIAHDQYQARGGVVVRKVGSVPLYRQPKPDIDMEEHKRLQALDPDDYSEAERARVHQKRWEHETRRALSRGDLDPQEAWNNGYKGHGHDTQYNGDARWHDTDRHNLAWEHLPQTLWHVTTNKAGVLADGHLKSRDELGQMGGHGLGGGDSDTISFTDDPEVARHIHRALHEYHSVLTGKKTIPHMLEEARQGGYLHHVVGGQYGGGSDWKDGDPLPDGLREGLKGRRIDHSGKMSAKTVEEAKAIHPDAEPVEGDGHWDAPKGRIHLRYSVPMDDDEKRDWASSHYKYHAAMREHFGKDKVMDPGFIFNDVKGMASTHPSQFGILRVHPKPGSRGYKVSALGEWRTVDGSVAHIGGLESPHGPEEGPQHTALRVLAKQAKQDSSGYLPNPYREDTDEWFHGSRHRPGDGEFDDLDPVAMREGHRPPGNGAGGPQMNKLLGVHLSALHDVAHGFADSSSDHGKIFHAQLRMKNPIHFEDESSLLRHVWNSTMRDDHFHDEHHDKSLMEWNYGAGATREGINRRLDRAKTAEPGSLARRGPHSSMESYLQFHPRQKEIAEHYIGHLRDEGHDGITYGNNVEGPRLHHCAIAFDKKQIKVTHVDRMHPSHQDHDVERQRRYQWMPTVSHDHIRSIHGEPEDFLHEVERYHSGGTLRTDPGHSYFGPNTGRGDFKFHQGAQEHPDKGDFGTHVTLKDMGITDVGDIGRHPESESMESYGIHWGKDHIAENDYDPDQFDSFHTETVDEPLSNIRYKQGQSHVIHPYVEHLAKVPAHELEPAWAQRMPDGTALLMEGHHRAAAASLRGDTTLKTTVYGKWGPGEREAGHARWKQQHGKTSGLHGDLPEGITYEHRPPNRRHNHHVLIAHHPDAEFESGYENHAGHLTWFEDDGEIGGVDVSEPYQRQGIATALFRRAQEITPSLHHARTLTDEGKAWKQSLGALLPGYVKEHPWLPTGKVFAPGKGCLDPVLFDAQHRMRPHVRKTIFDRLHLVLGSIPDWEDWCRVYLAGSEASEWFGNCDFDTLIGINYARARKAHPEWKDATDEEISGFFNRIFRQAYNDEHWRAPWDGEEWHLTAYSNPDSWDIRRIRPYAAYNMSDRKWAVKPVKVGADWGPQKWPEAVWGQMEAYLQLIEAIEHLPQPEQMRQGAALYDFLHGDRSRAFSSHGTGWNDPGNVLWKALDLHPSEPLSKLVEWKHQENKDPGEAAA